ncbi:MAG: DUF3450 domain-containing protein [Desulfobacteraceae bacterium]|nr:DUF3450 domain-containing protein [Desulfobacteraceae bacterium]
MLKRSGWSMVWTVVTVFLLGGVVNGKPLTEKVRDSVKQAVNIRQETQKNQEQWFQEKEALTAEYMALEQEHQRLWDRQRQLEKERSAREATVEQLTLALGDMEEISTGLAPFLKTVLKEIETLVAFDPPMLKQERQHRVAKLKTIIEASDVPVSEKFRKTMETLFIEADYGNTIEVYQEKIQLENETVLADIFRLGRLSLFCKTPDGSLTGVFDPARSAWQPLPASFNQEIARAVEMGSKRRAVDFLTLPLGKVVPK